MQCHAMSTIVLFCEFCLHIDNSTCAHPQSFSKPTWPYHISFSLNFLDLKKMILTFYYNYYWHNGYSNIMVNPYGMAESATYSHSCIAYRSEDSVCWGMLRGRGPINPPFRQCLKSTPSHRNWYKLKGPSRVDRGKMDTAIL